MGKAQAEDQVEEEVVVSADTVPPDVDLVEVLGALLISIRSATDGALMLVEKIRRGGGASPEVEELDSALRKVHTFGGGGGTEPTGG